MGKKRASKKTGKKSGAGKTAEKAGRARPTTARGGRSAPAPKGPSETPAQSEALQGLRRKIDSLDSRLVRLLNERAGLVVEVGKVKRGGGAPIYAPHREAQVLDKVVGASKGPLPSKAIEAIYKELMSGSFALEHPLRIGYLGPPGSYSHVAATRQFGSSVEYDDLHQIAGVFTEVRRGHVNYGLVPIENSAGGGEAETLDAFLENAGKVTIYAEAQLAVHHALLANCAPASVRRVHAKPDVFNRCRGWLATQYPQAEQVPTVSSARAVQQALEENRLAESIGAEPGSAAIGSELAGKIYGMETLFAGIEDVPDDITRFLVISREKAKRSGDDKTSIMFNTPDKPGALVSVLQVFDRAGINLTHIDKRPSGRSNWQYTFFIDAQGHRDEASMASAVREAEGHCKDLVVLGSYPRSSRIL